MKKMRKSASLVMRAAVMAATVLAIGSSAKAAINIDGQLDIAQGYTLYSTQTHATTSQSAGGGGPGGAAQEATSASTGEFSQISNAYASLNKVGKNLKLFLGGSASQANNNDTRYVIALQIGTNGVTDLSGKTINGAANSGSLATNIKFSSNDPSVTFAPTALFYYNPANNSLSYTNLSSNSYADPGATSAFDNSLLNTPIGTGGGNPGFAAASTGAEFNIPLASLGYNSGDIRIFTFFSVGSDTRTNNQILAPFQNYTAGDFDYTYLDNKSGLDPNGRQFVQAVYPGQGFFVVPEPTSLGVMSLFGTLLLTRRAKKRA